MAEFETRLKEYCKVIDKELDNILNRCDVNKQILFDAMRYSVGAGGKRIRPVLLLEFNRICGGKIEDALPFACAMEMIHTYSLIHDDLPCMDDDDMRRGKPSCHKAFGEANALLAGDALLNLAFETMLSSDSGVNPELKIKAAAAIGRFSGAQGMIGGQVIDLQNEGKEISEELLLTLYRDKTGGNGRQCGSFGDYSAVSYNGNKIITGSAGGCLLTNDIEVANKARKWSTQARENAPWYQHEEVGYNYRMSNVVAGIIRGQYEYLEEHIAQKKAVYERYCEGFKGLPVKMNPIVEGTEPNYWLSALTIDEEYMCRQVRDDSEGLYVSEKGKTCPTEILERLAASNAEGRPIWKPMHMQPMYRMHEFITRQGSARAKTNAYIAGGCEDVGADIFARGLCLPSDNKMTVEEQELVISIVRSCFE